MKSRLRYFMFVVLCTGIFPFSGYASIADMQAIPFEKESAGTCIKTMPDSNKLDTYILVFLLRNIAVKENDSSVSKFRLLSCAFSDHKNQKKLRNDIFSSTQHTPTHIFHPPLGYYIYVLERIRI